MKFSLLDRKQAWEILNWRYTAGYDYYNFSRDRIKEDLDYLLDRKNAFFAISNYQDELEGYCSFGIDGQVPGGQYSLKALDIGMGIHPNLIGRGRGKEYAKAIAEYGIKKYKAKWLRVTIANFNQRARRVWEQLGFKQVEKFIKIGTEEEFVVMVYAVSTL